MSVEEIPADIVVEMTDLLHRAFNAGGCDPMCHCCEKMIPVGMSFKLATISKTHLWIPDDLDLKLKERKGKEITEKMLWKHHDMIMRYDGFYRWSESGELIQNKQHERVTYEQFISNKDRPFRDTDKSVFHQLDLNRWEEIKQEFKDESLEVMLCDMCTPEEYTRRENKKMRSIVKEANKPKGGCFRVNGKIVH